MPLRRNDMLLTRAYRVWTMDKLYAHLRETKILEKEALDSEETEERTVLLYIIMQISAERAQHGYDDKSAFSQTDFFKDSTAGVATEKSNTSTDG